MTTLYDKPKKNSLMYDSSDSDTGHIEDEDEGYEMAEYDLDVVDNALSNPNRKEYMDHFGFTIQVRTDDESSSDDESDFDDEQHSTNAATTTTALTSDDDSIDTHLTTPQHESSDHKHNNVPILKSPPASIKNNNRSSILSFNNPFKARHISIQSSPVVISRPSHSFQQRQSKRYSEIPSHFTPRSPASNHRNFDKLVSRFRRFSHNDHQYDSEKHLLLKQEALEEILIYKEKGGYENNSYDWDFWSMTITNFSKMIETQMDDIRQHLIKGGIPSPIRGLMWQIISKSRDIFDMELEYKELIKKSSPFEKQIQRDLGRTFPNHPYFMQESGKQSLYNVAKAYSIFDQEVGYCQGLAFIIGCLLLHMSEENSFCVLIKLMGKYGLRGHFTPRMEVLHQHMYQFDNVFQQKLPVIHRHMENEGVTPSMYASQWFITLFSYRCPIEISFRILDLLLIEGSQIIVQIALAIIIRNQEKILKLHFDSLVHYLSNSVFDIFEENDDFIEDVYRIDLPARFMARLAQQYTDEVNGESKSISQEDNLRRINGQLSEHIRIVEGNLQQLRLENKDMTQQVINSKMNIALIEDEKQQLQHELNQYKLENSQLIDKNLSLVNQLTDTESMLIEMKLSFAERQSEYEELRRQVALRK